MIVKLIAWSLSRRGLVAAFALALLVAGALYVRSMPVDAIPDLSDVQVIVYTDYPGQAPQVVENQVTYPLVTALLGVPNTKVVRGQSMFSTSFVYVIFKEGTDLYWARSRVLERLNAVQSKLPAGAKTELGPDATGIGWVYQYALDGDGFNPAQLRTIQHFQVRYALQGVPGVAEVASIGGFVWQYQVLLDPARLQAFGITAQQIVEAVRGSNQDIGARTVEVAGSDYAIRGLGYFRGMDDIANVAVGAGAGGRPLRVGDVAQVTIGPDLRIGIAERNGRGEAVGGVVVMRVGANALDVVNRVKAKLAELAPSLPPGVRVVTTYDRTDLIHRSITTLYRTLIEESLIVGLVCVLFLLHARSALVAIATLPLGILAALAAIRWMGINANIMSLGGIAIAIGAMIDAAIVMIENLHKHIEHEPDRPRWERVLAASREVGPTLFMSLLIITLSFLPVFTLEDQEGRLFRPLALTKTFAMAAAAILSVTVVPVLMGFLVRGRIRPESANPLNRGAARAYRPVLRWALRARVLVIAGAVVVLGLTLIPFANLGSEFMPPLREGSLMYMPNTLPSVSLTQQRLLLRVQDSILMTFPEVESVWGKAGRANTATDWAPVSMVETTVNLKLPSEWRTGMTQDALISEMDRSLRITGAVNSWTMPIKNRTDMLLYRDPDHARRQDLRPRPRDHSADRRRDREGAGGAPGHGEHLRRAVVARAGEGPAAGGRAAHARGHCPAALSDVRHRDRDRDRDALASVRPGGRRVGDVAVELQSVRRGGGRVHRARGRCGGDRRGHDSLPRSRLAGHRAGGRRPTRDELVGAIEYGAVNRLRPKLMTVAAIMLGLLPALWNHGTGAEVMQRIAAPMIGGMITSTVLTLVVIPALYYLWRRRGLETSTSQESLL